jgi:hypothetical protein
MCNSHRMYHWDSFMGISGYIHGGLDLEVGVLELGRVPSFG